MYSSVFLKLTVCLLYSSSLPLYSGRLLTHYSNFGILLTYIEVARTPAYRKHMTWSLSSQSIGALAGPTANMSRDRYLLLCDATAGRNKTEFPLLLRARSSILAWFKYDVLPLLHVGICLRSCGLAMGIHVTIRKQLQTPKFSGHTIKITSESHWEMKCVKIYNEPNVTNSL
jgi:hypothetical protein